MNTIQQNFVNINKTKFIKLKSKCLSIIKEGKSKNLHFLENILDNEKPTKKIICKDDKIIYISYNLGETISPLFKNKDYIKCFTTKKYHILVNKKKEFHIYNINKPYDLINTIKDIKYPWLGSWSITADDNIILFGEYGDYDNEMCIYKSIDYGFSFNKSFIHKNTNEKKIRHFHTCYNIDNKCYISSGDNLKHNHNEVYIWESINKGSSFNKIKYIKNNDTNFNNRIKESFENQRLKHCCYSYIKKHNSIYWGTDVVFNMSIDDKKIWKSALVKFNLNNNTIQLIDTINYNPIRAQYNINDKYILFFSEQRRFSKEYFKSSEIGIYDIDDKKYSVIYTFNDIDSLNPGNSCNFFDGSKYIYQENNEFIFFLELSPCRKDNKYYNGGIIKFIITLN